MQKKLQVLADFWNVLDPTLVFFWNSKKNHLKKDTSVGFNWFFDPTLVFFLNENFFEFPKKLQVLDQVHFKKIYNDWISHVFFLHGSSHFLSPNGQG